MYAQLTSTSGPKKVGETAKRLGITTKLDGFPAEGLGGLRPGVSPLEMAGAYATLANGGMRHKPIAISRSCSATARPRSSARARASGC